MGTHTFTTEELYAEFAAMRGVETPCKGCTGLGTKAYGSTSTWSGGVGGQMITGGVCDKCWGSGDEHVKWPSHRRMRYLEQEILRLRVLVGDVVPKD